MKLDVVKDQFLRIGKIEVDPEMITVEPKDGLHWRTRFDFAVSDNGHVGLYASKQKKLLKLMNVQLVLRILILLKYLIKNGMEMIALELLYLAQVRKIYLEENLLFQVHQNFVK